MIAPAGSAVPPIESEASLPMLTVQAMEAGVGPDAPIADIGEGRDLSMMRASGYDAYQRVQAETSTPGQLIALLYDAMLRSLDRAKAGLERRDLESAHAPLLHAQDIVLELIASLNMDDAGEAGTLARQMAPLYEYMYRRLLEASLKKDASAIDEVRGLVTPLRDAWANVLEQLSRQVASAPAPRTAARRG